MGLAVYHVGKPRVKDEINEEICEDRVPMSMMGTYSGTTRKKINPKSDEFAGMVQNCGAFDLRAKPEAHSLVGPSYLNTLDKSELLPESTHGKKFLLVTNNDKVLKVYGDHEAIGVDYQPEGSSLDILVRVRDLVHEGWHLMSHPQASNLKPNQSPYKTVLISKGRAAQSFAQDVEMVESSIYAFYKFTKGMIPPNWPEKVLRDFQTIDLSVVASSIDRALLM